MSLSAIFTEIEKLLPANVKQSVGNPAVYGEDGVPRVVWFPVAEAITSTRGHGGDSSTGMYPGTASIATREVQCECHVWAANMDLTEQLADIVHLALQKLIWGSFSRGNGRWLNNEGQTVKFGQTYVMDVVIQIPVLRPAEYHVHVTNFVQTCQMQFLNGNTETV